MAVIAGWMEQILGMIGNSTARHVGTIVSLFCPADAMWRRAAYELQPAVTRVLQISPFGVVSAPSMAMIAWAVAFVFVVLGLAIWQFRARPL